MAESEYECSNLGNTDGLRMDNRAIAVQQVLDTAQQRRTEIYRFTRILVFLILESLVKLLNSLYNPQPKHTSVLTGHAWVLELVMGHTLCYPCTRTFNSRAQAGSRH